MKVKVSLAQQITTMDGIVETARTVMNKTPTDEVLRYDYACYQVIVCEQILSTLVAAKNAAMALKEIEL